MFGIGVNSASETTPGSLTVYNKRGEMNLREIPLYVNNAVEQCNSLK